jgi:guanyl-specific ribonuclease Sa
MAKQKASMPIVRAIQLPNDVRTAIATLKTRIRASLPRQRDVFENRHSPLPNADQGCQYYRIQVGAAHPGDPRPAGRRRLVVEVNVKAREIREIYFSDEHYRSGTFRRVVS